MTFTPRSSPTVIDRSGFTGDIAFTVAAPTGMADGDQLVTYLCLPNSAGSVNPPSGWALVHKAALSTWQTLFVYKKLANGEPASWTWTLTSGAGSAWTAIAIAVPGAPVVDGQATSTSTAITSTVTAPSVTTRGALDLLLTAFNTNLSSGTTYTPPAGVTLVATTGGGNGLVLSLYQQQLSGRGATGTRTFTASSGFNAQEASTIAVGRPVSDSVGILTA